MLENLMITLVDMQSQTSELLDDNCVLVIALKMLSSSCILMDSQEAALYAINFVELFQSDSISGE